MSDVKLKLDNGGKGSFYLEEGGKEIGEMVISIKGHELTVYHTEVIPEMEGKGIAGKLLEEMVRYAREHQLKVIALCPYVRAQFSRHPEKYEDIWKH